MDDSGQQMNSSKEPEKTLSEEVLLQEQPQALSLSKPKPRSKFERMTILVAGICIILGFAIFVYGEQSTGIGLAGVVNKLIYGIGMAIFSVGVIIVGLWFLKWIVAGLREKSSADRFATIERFFKQLGIVFLNVIIYGGIFVLALGGLSALDGASIGTIGVVLIAWAICVLIFVLYRKHRKKHKIGYDLVGHAGMTAFLLAIGAFSLTVFFGSNTYDAIRDLQEGPETADVLLVNDTVHHPAVYYRLVLQSDHILTFYTPEDERIVLEIPDKDIGEAVVIDDYGDYVHLTYYPYSQVYCEATRWTDGPKAFSPELFNRLVEEYHPDFGDRTGARP